LGLLGLLVLVIAVASGLHSGQAKEKTAVKILGSFTNRFGMVNKYVLIKRGLKEAELIRLARSLHRKEPKTTFWFLDDDSKADQLLTSLKDIEAGNSDTFPAEWFNEHIVANLQEWFGSGRGRYWVLSKKGGMDKIAEID
jgi:hypothetical protein